MRPPSINEYPDILKNRMSNLPLMDCYDCLFRTILNEAFDPLATSVVEELEQWEYPPHARREFYLEPDGCLYYHPSTKVDEDGELPPRRRLEGDFYLVLYHFASGPAISIPFASGKISLRTEEWERKDGIGGGLGGQVTGVVAGGFRVSVLGQRSFLPKSLVPEELRSNPEKLLGMVFDCEVLTAIFHPPLL